MRPLPRLSILSRAEYADGARPMDACVPSALQVWRDPAGRVVATCESVAGVHRVHVPGIATYQFDDVGDVVQAIPQGDVDAGRVREGYERDVLPMVLQALGWEVLHASAVLTPAGGLAFCGVSGAGKSTLAYHLQRRGYPALADDALALDVSGTSPRTVPVPFRLRLRPASASFFGSNGDDPIREGVPEPAPLAAICILERSAAGTPPRVTRLAAAAAFAALLPHAYCFSLQVHDRKRRLLDRYLRLVARVPILGLAFEGRLDALPHVEERIERLATCLRDGIPSRE